MLQKQPINKRSTSTSVNSEWTPKVLTASAHTGSGIDDVWKLILAYEEQATRSGFFRHNRGLQNMEWFQITSNIFCY